MQGSLGSGVFTPQLLRSQLKCGASSLPIQKNGRLGTGREAAAAATGGQDRACDPGLRAPLSPVLLFLTLKYDINIYTVLYN